MNDKIKNYFKQIPITSYVIGLAVLLFFGTMYFVVSGIISDNKKLAYAEAYEKISKQSNEEANVYQQKYNALLEKQSDLLSRITELENKVKQEDQARQQRQKIKIATIKAKVKPIEVAKDVKEFLGIDPKITPNGFEFTIPQVQDIVINAIKLEDLEKDNESLVQQLVLSQQRVEILQGNIDEADELIKLKDKALTDCQNTSTAYKSAAKKSFAAKLWSGTKRVGGYVAIAAIVLVLTK